MRRRPLAVGQWARRMDDVPYEESLVKLLACKTLPGGYEMWTVRSAAGQTVELMAGYLSAASGAEAP